MKTKIVFGVLIMMFVLVQVGTAGGKNAIQTYFNDTACKVKATADPEQKREIMEKSLQTMSKALEKAETMGLISQDDRAGIDLLKTSLQEKQDELAGTNGFQRVADDQLNAYSNYVVQDMEQATQTITISLVALLLIIIIVVLIA